MTVNEQVLKVQLGDKVRVKSGDHKGQRGIVVAIDDDVLTINLSSGNPDEVTVISDSDVTNYSLAARRAWQRIPKKAGRPQSLSRKIMVSIRLDSEVWARLGGAVEKGLIPSRESAVNTWLRERLDAIMGKPIIDDESQLGVSQEE